MEFNAVLAIFSLISGDMFDQICYAIIVNLVTTSQCSMLSRSVQAPKIMNNQATEHFIQVHQLLGYLSGNAD